VVSTVSVSGGPGGISAHYDDLRSAAGLLERGAVVLGEVDAGLTAYLGDPGLLAGALLDPVGAAHVELELLACLTRLAVPTARCLTLAAALEAAATAYQSADDLGRDVLPELRALAAAPGAARAGLWTFLRSANPDRGAERALTADPQLAELAQRQLAWTVLGTPPAQVRGLLSRYFDDGHPVVQDEGRDESVTTGPRSVAELMTQLAHRNDGRPGEISVSVSAGRPGAPRQVIVDIPGTKDWSAAPVNPDVTNLASNLRAIDGAASTYQRGVLQALRDSGITSADSVLLVGHSLGGMIAVNTAVAAAASGEFRINRVVTAGAPIGATSSRIPASVKVLALENDADVVPQLDARTNADRPSLTTVTVHHDHGVVGANHDLRASYVPAAEEVDASSEPSVRAYLGELAPFLSGDAVITTRYQISRGP
jgi:pimeloyl-ACP methyl ester carboxylesterase